MQSCPLKLLFIEYSRALILEIEHPNKSILWYNFQEYLKSWHTLKRYSVFVSFLYYWEEQKWHFTQKRLWFHYFKSCNCSLLCSCAGLNLYNIRELLKFMHFLLSSKILFYKSENQNQNNNLNIRPHNIQTYMFYSFLNPWNKNLAILIRI